MKIGIASDHDGYEAKETLKENFNKLFNQYEIIDFGNKEYDESDDYPIFAFRLAEAVSKKEVDFGIVLCNTGIGVSIACNKVIGVRCALINSIDAAVHTRQDNDANIISLNGQEDANKLMDYIIAFINTPFSNIQRHERRINEISSYESKLK